MTDEYSLQGWLQAKIRAMSNGWSNPRSTTGTKWELVAELLICLYKMNNNQNLDGTVSTRENANRQRELTFARPRQSCPDRIGKIARDRYKDVLVCFASFRAALTLVHQCDVGRK